MSQRIIVIDSPYEPELEAHLLCGSVCLRYIDFAQDFSVRNDGENWVVEFNGEINGLDLRLIREYAEGFYDGILALKH